MVSGDNEVLVPSIRIRVLVPKTRVYRASPEIQNSFELCYKQDPKHKSNKDVRILTNSKVWREISIGVKHYKYFWLYPCSFYRKIANNLMR